MKQVFVLVIIAFISIQAKAQDQNRFSKGQWFVGGDFSFSNNSRNLGGSTGKFKTSNLSFSGEVGYFVIPKLAVTLTPIYARNSSENTSQFNPNRNVYREYSLNAGIRGYVIQNLFLYGSIGWGKVKEVIEIPNLLPITIESTPNVFVYSAGVGYSLFLIKKVSLEPRVFYRFRRIGDVDAGADNNSFNFSVGFRIFL
ncbi:hypothetical protein BKI52_25030 [marine bacterium AO1-C]|nr:hypothetical protein BKI52_25030 [marine bacterium AO1-C]